MDERESRLHRTCKKLRNESNGVERLNRESAIPRLWSSACSSKGEGSEIVASSIAGSGSVVCEPGLLVPIDSSETIVGNMSVLEHDIIEEIGRDEEIVGDGSVREETGRNDRDGGESVIDNDEDVSEPTTRELMKLFHGLMTGFQKVTDRGSDTLMDKGRMVSNIPSYMDGSEISKYIRGLEADLKDIGVSQRQYKRILLSKLSPKAREQVVDLVDSGECTYELLKRKLLEKVGLSKRDLEIKLFCDLEDDTKGMDRLARYKHNKATN